jgi:hypothetical protein
LDLANCFDCSRPLSIHLIGSAIGLALAILAAISGRYRYQWARLLFWIASVLTVGWYSIKTFAVLKYGILWPATDGSEILWNGARHIVVATRAADYIFLVAWYAVSLLLMLGARAIVRRFKV